MHRKIKQYIDKYTALGYGEDHLLFAAHAAFPTGVTPHLLYQLWANFSVVPGRTEGLNSVVVSDFLLSNLCRETSLGIFEINGRIRTELLDLLEKDQRFGPKRLKELAYFLYQYIQKGTQDADFAVFREAQYWTALSVIAPQKAALEIGQMLSDKIKAADQGEILRVSSLLQQIGQKNQSFDNLVNYAQGLKDGLLDRPQAAQQAFNKVMVVGPDDPDQESFSLKIPLMPSVITPSTNFQKAPSSAERIALARIAEASNQLDLSNISGLKKIPEVVKDLKGLRELIVNNSDLEEVPAFLEEMDRLEVINLSDNQIKHLPASFSSSLRHLDLRYNKLRSIDRLVFLLDNLETLDISDNQLSIMPASLLDVSKSLSRLEVQGNPWLNLPTDFNFPTSMQLIGESWQDFDSPVDTIHLLDLGALQGEVFLEIQEDFQNWIKEERLNIKTSIINQRFGLFAGESFRVNLNMPILYLTGEDFRLIIDSSGEEQSTLSPEQLVQLWQPFKEVANLIILNIGESIRYAQALVNDGFKAVIAADFSLDESQRYKFQSQFFAALQAGDDLRAAYDIAATSGPSLKGDFSQQVKTQQNISSEGPNLSMELNTWRIIENTEGPQTDWTWKLPDLEPADEEQPTANAAENPLLDAWKRGMISILAGEDVEDYLEQIEAKIRIDTTAYDNLVLLSAQFHKKKIDFNNGILRQEAFFLEKETIRTKLMDLVGGIRPDAYQVSRPKLSTNQLSQLKFGLKTALRKFQIENVFNTFKDNLKPVLLNYDGYLLQSRYRQYKKARAENFLPIKEEDKAILGIVRDTYIFIKQLEGVQLNTDTTATPNYSGPKAFFVGSVLNLLANNEIEKALFFFNDYTVSTTEFMQRFNEWLENYDRNQTREQDGSEAYSLFLTLRNQYLQDFKVFLEEVENGNLLMEDFLPKRAESIEEEIASLNMQKYFDEGQMEQLKTELGVIKELISKAEGLHLPQVQKLYNWIAENELLTAAAFLHQVTTAISSKFAIQAKDLQDRIVQLEQEQAEMDFSTYQKEHNRLIEGLILTINDLWRNRPKDELDDPDLIQYFKSTASRQVAAGQLKPAFRYLLFALAPSGSLMEDTVALSARYYLLEAAQYQENIDYKSVLDQLNSITRYLQNIIESEGLRLQPNFVKDELERVEAELQKLSRQGKSKKFNIRDDGDYQELQAARNLLRKFLP